MPTLIGNSSLIPWTSQWPLLLSKVLQHHIEKLWHHISRQACSDVVTNPSFIVPFRLPRTTWEMRQREAFLSFFGVFCLMQAYVIVNIWLFYSTALFSWYKAVWEKGGWVTRCCSSFHEHSSHFQITQPFKIWDIMKNLNVDVSTYC